MSVTAGVSEKELQNTLAEAAERHEVPGVTVGVYHDGVEHYAFHGVTNIENPLPVDENTIFQFGSTGKTFTAALMLRLVEEGKVDLNAPVRTYLPDFKLKDEETAANVTVLQLFNHTAGWQGDFSKSTGDGDDALGRFVENMVEIDQISPLGSAVSYNNASLSVAGHIIATVTGKTYEQAMKEMIFEPLGMENSWFFPNDIMTRRFVSGHNQKPDGTITVARPWALPRNGNPAGGISANAEDQIKWVKFHLGDGKGVDGSQVLTRESLDLMKEPTVEMRGSAIGDYVGISWLIQDRDGVRIVGHGGTTNGQLSDFAMVPDRNFGVIVMTNCAPNGAALYKEMTEWAFKSYLGVELSDPEPVQLSADELKPYLGTYETIAATAELTADDGGLLINIAIKPDFLKELLASGEEDPGEQPPLPLGILPGEGDRYIITGGPAKGMTGYFVRGEGGEVEAIHVGGRLATRTS